LRSPFCSQQPWGKMLARAPGQPPTVRNTVLPHKVLLGPAHAAKELAPSGLLQHWQSATQPEVGGLMRCPGVREVSPSWLAARRLAHAHGPKRRTEGWQAAVEAREGGQAHLGVRIPSGCSGNRGKKCFSVLLCNSHPPCRVPAPSALEPGAAIRERKSGPGSFPPSGWTRCLLGLAGSSCELAAFSGCHWLPLAGSRTRPHRGYPIIFYFTCAIPFPQRHT